MTAKPERHVDAAIAAIDAVLDGHDTQRSPEHGAYIPEECWRCQRSGEAVTDVGLCQQCTEDLKTERPPQSQTFAGMLNDLAGRLAELHHDLTHEIHLLAEDSRSREDRFFGWPIFPTTEIAAGDLGLIAESRASALWLMHPTDLDAGRRYFRGLEPDIPAIIETAYMVRRLYLERIPFGGRCIIHEHPNGLVITALGPPDYGADSIRERFREARQQDRNGHRPAFVVADEAYE